MVTLIGLRWALIAALLSVGTLAAAQSIDGGKVAVKVAALLQSEHYSDLQIDDEISKEFLNQYLEMLDPGKLYFLQSDIDQFNADFKTKLDDFLLAQNVAPGNAIFDTFRDRVKNRVAFVKDLLDTEEFTFDSDRKATISRKDLPWPANNEEYDRIWRNEVESQLLQEVLQNESASAKGKPVKKDPKKVVMNRYNRILDSVVNNTREDVLGFYLSALSHAYDPHTDYFTQSEFDNFQIHMRNSLTGIGARLGITEEGVPEIQGIIVGGPANKAGELKVGDKVIAVGEQGAEALTDVVHMNLQGVVDLIRGEKGSVVELEVIPVGGNSSETKIIKITRDEVELKESLARAELIKTKDAAGKPVSLGWIDLPSFYADMEGGETGATKDVKLLLDRLIKEKIDGLVLDLRQNGGGSLREAVNLTGLFIPQGPVVAVKDSRDKVEVMKSKERTADYAGPMVVLTSKESASASEILAAALQDYGRAVVVGDSSTFGKGTVQNLQPITTATGFAILFPGKDEQAGALKLTIQKFYRIAGGSTQLKGVVPDIQLPSLTDALDFGEDSLENALPYDEIDPRRYKTLDKVDNIDQLRKKTAERVANSVDFQWIEAEKARIEERKKKNQLSLNKEVRKAEIEADDKREKAHRAEQAKHYEEILKKEKDLFKTFSITLDGVDETELRLLSDLSSSELSGVVVEKEEEGDAEKPLDPPHNFAAEKREAINILLDMVKSI